MNKIFKRGREKYNWINTKANTCDLGLNDYLGLLEGLDDMNTYTKLLKTGKDEVLRYDLASVRGKSAAVPIYIDGKDAKVLRCVWNDSEEWNLIPEHIRNNTPNE